MVNTFRLPQNFSVELSGYYDSNALAGMNQFRPWKLVNVGIQKTFADGMESLGLSINNIFQSNEYIAEASLPEDGINTYWSYDSLDRSINLTFTWKFGNNKLSTVSIDPGAQEEQSRVNTQ